MRSGKTVSALFSVFVLLSLVAAECGAHPMPHSITRRVLGIGGDDQEREKAVETVVLEEAPQQIIVGVGALPHRETLFLDLSYQDVPTFDPALAKDTSGIQVGVELFPGLIRLHEESGAVQPGMAIDWNISDDGLVYTFHVRDDVPWVKFNNVTGRVEEVLDEAGNVRMVNAHDFVYGVRRTLDPHTGSSYAYVNWIIQNAGAVNGRNGQDDPLFGELDAIGVKALDDYTLQYTLEEPAAFFLSITSMWINWAQPQWLIEEKGQRWIEAGIIQSYGPYALFDWTHDASITFIANPFWPGTEAIPRPSIKYVHGVFLDAPEAFANYEAGLLDTVEAPLGELERIQADPVLSQELAIYLDTCTYYYGFNVTRPPFDDVNVRKAFSWAIDRTALVENVTQSGQEPARWFSRPGLTAAPDPRAGDDFGPPSTADVEGARRFLAASSYGRAETLPEITLMHNESDAHSRIAQAIQHMWKENLGVEVNIVTQEWKVYLQTLEEDPPQIWRLGWCDDYPDASNFARDVFRSDSGNNHTGWGSRRFDSLVDQAALETDPDKRHALYVAAEKILVEEQAVIIPIYWYAGVELTRPYVKRTFGKGSQNYWEKWSIEK